MAISSISLFAGAGMLDEGFRAGLEHLGIGHRCVCYVEREAYAASLLAARMEEGSLDQAPVWSDVTTFDAKAWRGKVDCVVAGFPCQDLSVAGKRAGLGGKRSGLFFEVLRIATDCGARFLFLENVAGIASATASVVDDEEGELLERAASRVMGELADRGWDAEWLHLRASDVGASHRRERWFCLAWREGRPDPAGTGGAMADASGQRFSERCLTKDGHRNLRQERTPASQSGDSMADAIRDDDRRADRVGGGEWEQGEIQANNGELSIFAPGPDDPRWPGIIERWLWLAPAVGNPASERHGLRGKDGIGKSSKMPRSGFGETKPKPEAPQPDLRGVADGLAPVLDGSRAARLRCCGNGVVAAQAAFALVELVRRMKW